MNFTQLKKIAGFILIALGTFGIATLLFFYAVVLFSEKWPGLKPMYEVFRLLFTIPTGIVVIYATFIVIAVPLLFLVLIGAQVFSGVKYITKTQVILFGVMWAIALLFGSATVIHQAELMVSRMSPFSSNPVEFNVEKEIPLEVQYAFKTTLKNEVNTKIGVPIEGYEPPMFLQVFPGLTETDFEGVEASIGHYTIEEGRLVHKTDTTKLIHSAAKAITDRGLDRLLGNIAVRLKVDLTQDGTLTEIVEAIVRYSAPRNLEDMPSNTNDGDISGGTTKPPLVPSTPPKGDAIACTMEAKICSDGSSVGREGPNCEFKVCPITEVPAVHTCTADEKKVQACRMEYVPVCGQVVVQCIKAPCPPVPQTFGNACSACSASNVTSYTQGECT